MHRDIKPSNIGFGRDAVPKLMDFGLAKLIVESVPELDVTVSSYDSSNAVTTPSAETMLATSTARLIGTPAYFSPEAVLGEDPDTTWDLWALALTLYEALAARNPIQQSNIVQTLMTARSATIPDVREFSPHCPEKLALFFKDALAKDRRRRPATACELRKRLEVLAD